ncbi:MAG: hypothetical protein ACPGSD_17885 [Flavobacteriales bacterium]
MYRLIPLVCVSIFLTTTLCAQITNISTSLDNGIDRITNTQNANNASIVGRTVVLSGGSARLRATSSSGLVVRQSQIKCRSNVTAGNDNNAPITFGSRSNTSFRMRITDNSSILLEPLSGRKNIFLSELSNSEVIEGGSGRQLFVYTQRDAILDHAVFSGINVWEVYRSPSIASNINVENCNYGYLNWEAGRLDFLGFDVSNIQIAHAWLGAGNGGNNSVYHWNNGPGFDNTQIDFQSGNGRYYEGYSASWVFRNANNFASDVLFVYRSNLSGTQTELGRYTTNSNGKLVGVYDSQNQVNTASQERETVFFITAKSNIGGGSFNAGGGNNYGIDVVTPQIEIRSYIYNDLMDFTNTFSISAPIGRINSDYSLNTAETINLTIDENITETNKSTVLAYSEINNAHEFYDRAKAEWRDNDNFPLIEKNGNTIDVGSLNIVIDATAATAYAFSGNTLTIKSNSYTGDIVTTGAFSAINGAEIIGGYTDNTGVNKFIYLDWNNNVSTFNVEIINLDDNSTILTTSTTDQFKSHILMPNPNPASIEVKITAGGLTFYSSELTQNILSLVNTSIILGGQSTLANQLDMIKLAERLLSKSEAIKNGLSEVANPTVTINETVSTSTISGNKVNQEQILEILQRILGKTTAINEKVNPN